MKRYLYVNAEALPDYFVKVLDTKRLLDSGKAKNVTEAARMNGISRSTFYKYKDYVFDLAAMPVNQTAVFLLILKHEPGVLSHVLSEFSEMGANVLTISQNMPIQNKASVTLTVDMANVHLTTDEITKSARRLNGVSQIQLIALG